MRLKNIEMEGMIIQLSKHLDRVDKIGYAAARNTRILKSASIEYFERRDQLISEMGEDELDSDGRPTGRKGLKVSSPEFAKFVEAIEEYAMIEHDVELFRIPFSEAEGKISGNELLETYWMFED